MPRTCSSRRPWSGPLALEPQGGTVDPWDIPGGCGWAGRRGRSWLIARPATSRRGCACAAGPPDAEVTVGDGEPVKANAWHDGNRLYVRSAGVTRSYRHARDGDITWIGNWPLQEPEQLSRKGGAGAAGGTVTSPMPGTVCCSRWPRRQVAAGQPLLVVEAMKMEHTVVRAHRWRGRGAGGARGPTGQAGPAARGGCTPTGVTRWTPGSAPSTRRCARPSRSSPARRSRRSSATSTSGRSSRTRSWPRWVGWPVRPAVPRGARRHGRRLLRPLPGP